MSHIATSLLVVRRPCLAGLTIEQGDAYVDEGTADLICLGAPFISTPNIPALVAVGKKSQQLWNMEGANPKLWCVGALDRVPAGACLPGTYA